MTSENNDPKTHIRISRDLAALYGREALNISKVEEYAPPSRKIVDIGTPLRRAIAGTESYPPDRPLPESAQGKHEAKINVRNQPTLAAARNFQDQGLNPVILNFASATSAGGGFLTGSRAQEEYLARSSALFVCLEDNPMYRFHRKRRDRLYTNYVIYSPAVPVFRGDQGEFLEEPYTVGMITSPAVRNADLTHEQAAQVEGEMWRRILKVLSTGIKHGHDCIVLGAWGCGAFHNDPALIAGLFWKALSENFKGAYREVTFAITDWSEERRYIGPFEAEFAQEKSTATKKEGGAPCRF